MFRCALLLLILAACGFGETSSFNLTNKLIVLDSVQINGAGPFRFLLDTGMESSGISPRLAELLSIKPTSRTMLSTILGDTAVPLASARIEIGGVAANAEVVISPLEGVDGVIGQSFLGKVDYLIDYELRQFTIHPARSAIRTGQRVTYRLVDGRIEIAASSSVGTLRLVLDSGASTLVLYRDCLPLRSFSSGRLMVSTRNRATMLPLSRIDWMSVGGVLLPGAEATILSGGHPSTEDGLLPTHLFSFLYFENSTGTVVLGRRSKGDTNR